MPDSKDTNTQPMNSGVFGEVNSIGVGVVSNINHQHSVSGKLNSVGQSVFGIVALQKVLDNEHS